MESHLLKDVYGMFHKHIFCHQQMSMNDAVLKLTKDIFDLKKIWHYFVIDSDNMLCKYNWILALFDDEFFKFKKSSFLSLVGPAK